MRYSAAILSFDTLASDTAIIPALAVSESSAPGLLFPLISVLNKRCIVVQQARDLGVRILTIAILYSCRETNVLAL
jgi:hypothetical protein